jgi:NAD(P)-dependent dehydrogenase (short-subunit alcohol dehydrogenase family)
VRLFIVPGAVRENIHRAAGLRPGRPETIEETAELVTAAGGCGIAVKVDHTKPADVKKLVAGIKGRHKGLDILINDVWGGDALTEWGKTFWTVNLDNSLRMLKQAIHLSQRQWILESRTTVLVLAGFFALIAFVLLRFSSLRGATLTYNSGDKSYFTLAVRLA